MFEHVLTKPPSTSASEEYPYPFEAFEGIDPMLFYLE
jgi:hypothetical protein